MIEATPTPKKKIERLESTTLDGFTPVAEADAMQLPRAAIPEFVSVGVVDALEGAHDEHESDVLRRTDSDGIEIVIGSVTNKKDGHLSGVLVQVEGDALVGRTTFTSDGFGENALIYIGNTNTYLHTNQGMGEQRMRIINEYVKQKFGKSLSSISRSDSAQRVWDSLLERGLAERHRTGDTIVYTMK